MKHKRRQFVNEYLLSGNATEAAIKAGFSPKTAYSQGQRMLKNVEIKEAIQEGQKRLQEESQIKVSYVVTEINKIAKTTSNEHIKLKALDMLMRHLGGYMDTFKLITSMTEEQLEELAKRLPA